MRRAGRLGVEAQGAADHVAGADRQVDLPDTLCPDLAGDVLCGVDGHLDVDVEEAETDEGMEVVMVPNGLGLNRRSGTVQVTNRAVNGAEELKSW